MKLRSVRRDGSSGDGGQERSIAGQGGLEDAKKEFSHHVHFARRIKEDTADSDATGATMTSKDIS
jgi:hypothetical protein